MKEWFQALLAKLRRKGTARGKGANGTTDVAAALRAARDNTWSNTNDARRTHPGTFAGRK